MGDGRWNLVVMDGGGGVKHDALLTLQSAKADVARHRHPKFHHRA